MNGMNKYIIAGHIGRDAELRHIGDGTPVCNFTVATKDGYKGRDGNWQEQTEWHTVELWGRRAEVLAPWLTKGRKVLVDGKHVTQVDKSSTPHRYYSKCRAHDVQLLDKAAPATAADDDDLGEPIGMEGE